MQHSQARWRPTRLVRRAGPLGAVLMVAVACGGDDDSDSATAGSGGTNGGTSGTTSAGGNGSGGGSGGSTTASTQTQNSSSGGSGGSGGGSECTVHPITTECVDDIADEQCYTLEELSDPCSGTHLWSVHQGSAGANGAGGAGGALVGDGGTDECPSAEELFWGDVGERCGCFDTPACDTPTVQRGGQCCYRVERSCRLC